MNASIALPAQCSARTERYRLDQVRDEMLHTEVKALAGRHNALLADLLAHLAEVDVRGIYRERACSSLYSYCLYELRLSEDEAQRRVRAARVAREFPAIFEPLAQGALHLTGLLLLAPHLTAENHSELFGRPPETAAAPARVEAWQEQPSDARGTNGLILGELPRKGDEQRGRVGGGSAELASAEGGGACRPHEQG